MPIDKKTLEDRLEKVKQNRVNVNQQFQGIITDLEELIAICNKEEADLAQKIAEDANKKAEEEAKNKLIDPAKKE